MHEIYENNGVHTMQLYGRDVIRVDDKDINDSNVIDVVNTVYLAHSKNQQEIEYLWNYYKGKQPILSRKKIVRPEINNKVVENRANEIVNFKVGYVYGEPIQYVSRGGTEEVSEDISRLNEMMFSENKATQDKELGEWQTICGTAYRLVLPDVDEVDDAPFELYTLDPRYTILAYSTGIGEKRKLGVSFWKNENQEVTFDVYSDRKYWKIKNGVILESKPNPLGDVPIFEYPANNARLGAFEPVLPLLDSLNTLSSDRLNGVEQTIQAFLKFINCDIDEEQFKALKDLGAIKVKSTDGQKADVDIVKTDLDQNQTQTLVDHIYQTILTIVGMPSMGNGSTSDSSNNGAVILKNGWQGAETRAKDTELMFKKSEQEMLKLVLKICRTYGELNLKLRDIGMQFTRRNYEAIQSKAQVLVSMLSQEKIHPQLAFTHSGLFTDPEKAYAMSEQYLKDNQKIETLRENSIKNANNGEKTPEQTETIEREL